MNARCRATGEDRRVIHSSSVCFLTLSSFTSKLHLYICVFSRSHFPTSCSVFSGPFFQFSISSPSFCSCYTSAALLVPLPFHSHSPSIFLLSLLLPLSVILPHSVFQVSIPFLSYSSFPIHSLFLGFPHSLLHSFLSLPSTSPLPSSRNLLLP